MKTLVAIVLCLLLPAASWGAAPDSSATGRPNSLRAGAWAMQFDVNGQLISMDSFSGGVSLKRHMSARSALRFGVGISAATSSEELTNIDDEGDEGIASDYDRYGVYVEAVFQRYVNPDARVHLYWGAGPYIELDHGERSVQLDSTRTSNDADRFEAGALGILGVEWFASEDIGLHVEYTGAAAYFREESESSRSDTGGPSRATSERDGWTFDAGGVRFGLSVYF